MSSILLDLFGLQRRVLWSAADLPPVEKMRFKRTRPRAHRDSGGTTAINGGIIRDIEHNDDLRGDRWYGALGAIGVSGKMLRDPHVRQSVSYVADPLRGSDWRYKAASKSPLHIEQADYLTYCYVEQLPWDELLRQIVTGSCADGVVMMEQTDDIMPIPAARFPLHPGKGRGLVPTALHEITANTIYRWHQRKGKPTQLKAITQYTPWSDLEHEIFKEISADRLIRWTFDQHGSNFTGLALLRSAYGAWKCKIAFMAIDAIKHERGGVGTPTIILGEEVEEPDIEAAEDTLEQMRTNAKGFAIFPNGYEFKWEGLTTGSGTDVNQAIERCNKDIAVNVSAGFMLLGLTGKTGSYALGATQQAQYHLSIVGHSKRVAAPFTGAKDGWSPARRILEANYGPVDALPELQALNLPTRNWLDVMPQLINAVNVGIVTPDDKLEDEVRGIFQVCPRDEATSRKRTPQVAIETPKTEPDNDEDEESEDGEE